MGSTFRAGRLAGGEPLAARPARPGVRHQQSAGAHFDRLCVLAERDRKDSHQQRGRCAFCDGARGRVWFAAQMARRPRREHPLFAPALARAKRHHRHRGYFCVFVFAVRVVSRLQPQHRKRRRREVHGDDVHQRHHPQPSLPAQRRLAERV